MKRRALLALGATALLGSCAWQRWWPREGVRTPCHLPPQLPPELLQDPWLQQGLQGLVAERLWDVHVHLVGIGDTDSGIWVHPRIRSLLRPGWLLRYTAFLHASCAAGGESVDGGYVRRLLELHAAMPVATRLLLLAFDYRRHRDGSIDRERSFFHVPNEYARRLAATYPHAFGWICSIHPYREDCVEALEAAQRQGAQAVKWLPPAMAIDPASPRCDRFYAALARLRMPLLTHAGDEHAIPVRAAEQRLANPLRLRRALQQGVRVIIAHCANLGENPDLDRGEDGPVTHNTELFARMMDEPRYQGRLFGEISAMTLVTHLGPSLRAVLTRRDWQQRLLNGSDYPLPAVMPFYSTRELARRGYLQPAAVNSLVQVRRHNPLLYDLLLKRLLRADGHGFELDVFHSRERLRADAAEA